LAVNASTGAVIETRYKAWGEVRYTTPEVTLPTRNTFTGQYSYVSDDATDLGSSGFGLMFYNARWYDPSLGRMAQADTIVPGGVQGLDRYAYVNNSPVYYIDPTGHFTQNAIENYIIRECSAGHDIQQDEEKIFQCYDKTLSTWQADKEWWAMLRHARTGDVLVGSHREFITKGGYGGLTGPFLATFTGISDTFLSGLDTDSSLFDIQSGFQYAFRDPDGRAMGIELKWYGTYRPLSSGLPDPYGWFIRSGYEKTEGGPSGVLAFATDQSVSIGVGVILGGACAKVGFMGGLGGALLAGAACGLAGAGASYLVLDVLDMQDTDYHYKIGPVYINFQGDISNPYSHTYVIEHAYFDTFYH
ncbi:MAG: RHS repeat-associated core domain-containing protein, partial [Chloroflexota bacterium]